MLRREGFQFFDPLLNPLVGTNDLQDSILETVAHTTIRRRLNFAQNGHALAQPSCGFRPDPSGLKSCCNEPAGPSTFLSYLQTSHDNCSQTTRFAILSVGSTRRHHAGKS
jgi:hypothetical protein